MKNLILKISFICILASCASNNKNNKLYLKKIPINDLNKDVRFVHVKLVKMHPDLYWYISKNDLNNKFDSLQKTIKEPLTANEFYLKISPVVAAVHQGHMNLNLMQLKPADSIKKKYKYSTNPLENFEYAYISDKLYITKNKMISDSIIQVGSEVITINNIKPQTLYNKYRKTITSDGYNKTAIPKIFSKKINGYYVAELGLLDSISMELVCADLPISKIVYRTFKENTAKNKKQKNAISQKTSQQPDSLKHQYVSKKAKKSIEKAQRKQTNLEFKRKLLYGYDFKTNEYEKEVTYLENKTTAILKIRGFTDSKLKVYDTIFAH